MSVSSTCQLGSRRMILYSESLTIYRLPKTHQISQKIFQLPWYTISKTTDELSIVLPSSENVSDLFGTYDDNDIKIDTQWKCCKIDGVLDFSLVGILAEIVNPLKDAGVPVFVISTFDTDYILIKEKYIEKSMKIISGPCNYSVLTDQTLLS